MSQSNKKFVAVTIGSNLGAYSLARAFHEQYDVITELLCGVVIFPIRDSQLFNVTVDSNLHYEPREGLKKYVELIDSKYPGYEKIIMPSEDFSVNYVLSNTDLFDESWHIPFSDKKLVDIVANKKDFYDICETVGLKYPKTWALGADDEFPKDAKGKLVIKHLESRHFEAAVTSGIQKLYITQNEIEAESTLRQIRENGFLERLVLQEYIESEDTDIAVLTSYRSPIDKEVKLISFGRVLVEDRSKMKAGNHLTILTEDVPTEISEGITRLLEKEDYVGFANFDLIYDNSRGEWNFLELNPRLGYSNYQLTAQGYNVAKILVDDLLYEIDMNEFSTSQVVYTVIDNGLNKKYITNEYIDTFNKLKQSQKVFSPYDYKGDSSLKRKLEMLKYHRRARKEIVEGR